MKIYTDEELKEFLNGLNEGKIYCGILNGHGKEMGNIQSDIFKDIILWLILMER